MVLSLAFLTIQFASLHPALGQNLSLSFDEICEMNGYDYENHTVTTEDGYILTLFHLFSASSQSSSRNKPVVFLLHGLDAQAKSWIVNAPTCPGFYLVDAGFDVWLGNSRGSAPSQGHVKWDSKIDPEYWLFTWQHMAEFDIPASVLYVLQYTNKEKLTFIGHSQGNTIILAYLSENPDFMEKISLCITLSPPISLLNSKLREYADSFQLSQLSLQTVDTESLYHLGFQEFLQVENDNEFLYETVSVKSKSQTSELNYEHWIQMTYYQTSKLQKFDYGKVVNVLAYGQTSPPIYDLTRVPGPIALFVGDLDALADSRDFEWLENSLDKSLVFSEVFSGFGHNTFLDGKKEVMTYFSQVIDLALDYLD
jgi:pimeloyl-ACP methyl ester carboxylesterase